MSNEMTHVCDNWKNKRFSWNVCFLMFMIGFSLGFLTSEIPSWFHTHKPHSAAETHVHRK